jgi:hypothetical protein
MNSVVTDRVACHSLLRRGSPRPEARCEPAICIATGGHLATSPRNVKAADGLSEAGYRVRVVSANYTDWASRADQVVHSRRNWTWSKVDYSRDSARLRWLWCSSRYRVAGRLARLFGPGRCPLPLAGRAISRAHPELVRAILAEPVDLIYGGEPGAILAIAEAARRARVPYALDLEDFHSAEQAGSAAAELANGIAERIESRILGGAAFLTAGSDAIASAYRERYGVEPTTINNTFPLPRIEPGFSSDANAGLRLYWFSQTVGPNRGLEDVVRAMGLAGVPGQLNLRGRAALGYLDSLRSLAAEAAPRLDVVHHDPAMPDEMVDLCREYDVGLAVEQPHVLNRDLCLTNKAFTYMLAGLAVVFTDTRGQRPLARELGESAILYTPGDVAALAAGLRRWVENRDLLRQARIASWKAAQRRWHWEHPLERGALLELVAGVFRTRSERADMTPDSAGKAANR